AVSGAGAAVFLAIGCSVGTLKPQPFVGWASSAIDSDGERGRPKCATNRVPSRHFNQSVKGFGIAADGHGDRRPGGRRLFACKAHDASNMVNLKLRHCALGSAVRRPGTDSGSREGQRSTARVGTAAFLQQVPTTMELGPLSPWNCGVLLVIGYLIGAEGTPNNRLWGAPRA